MNTMNDVELMITQKICPCCKQGNMAVEYTFADPTEPKYHCGFCRIQGDIKMLADKENVARFRKWRFGDEN